MKSPGIHYLLNDQKIFTPGSGSGFSPSRPVDWSECHCGVAFHEKAPDRISGDDHIRPGIFCQPPFGAVPVKIRLAGLRKGQETGTGFRDTRSLILLR